MMDLQAPQVQMMSPSNGALNVPLNPRYHVRYDEEINTVNIAMPIGRDMSFSSDNKELLYKDYTPLASNQAITKAIPDVVDLYGNAAISTDIQFTTGSEPDTVNPSVIAYTPKSNETVAVNSIVRIRMDSEIDPLSINNTSFTVRDIDNGYALVVGNASLESDGRTIVWVSSSALPVGRRFYISASMADLSGNSVGHSSFFYTSLVQDITAPEIVATTVFEGQTDIPTNAQIKVRFNESIDSLTLTGVQLNIQGQSQAVNYELSSDRTLLTLKPKALLPANTAVIFEVAGVKDLAGNQLVASQIGFTSGSGVDVTQGSVVTYSPYKGTDNIPLNGVIEFLLNESVDPVYLTSGTVYLKNETQNRNEDIDIIVSSDRKHITLSPVNLLTANESYTAFLGYYYFNYVYDLSGNRIQGQYIDFNTALDMKNTPPQVVEYNLSENLNTVAINSSVRMLFDSPLNSLCVNANTVKLNNGNDVEGVITLSSDRDSNQITFDPVDNLIMDMQYTLSLNGVCDATNQPLLGYSFSFQTNSNVDGSRLSFLSMLPAEQSIDNLATSIIELNYNETIDPLSLIKTIKENKITVSDSNGVVNGNWALDDFKITFTPISPFALNSQIDVDIDSYTLTDQVGNQAYGLSKSFNTGAQ